MQAKPVRRRIRRPTQRIKITFSYKDISLLSRYITEQGMIIGRYETGLTQKQQRRLGQEIKRARHLALLPFTQTL